MKFHNPIIAAGPLIFVAAPGVADTYEGFGHMMWGGDHGIFGGLIMLIFWALIIGLIVLAVRGFSNHQVSDNRQKAIDLLRERFARGEIDDDEFERRLAKLEPGIQR
ncbi:SHOCT domain-containing protein [Aliiroseovarius sp. F47248L]|uniref:SHOCT domain-containing protein n=1 Tax=Aliiroseovarius sp. F47248L TaxID=2926420 RepID=UPI001FF12E9A|nr:SHOCT domain-containing protein [Aliiroseovarius sp. F47248L]MCK0137918.1 SHOCT domain-containing protein [Aliiroseovarius sp. F47248L]